MISFPPNPIPPQLLTSRLSYHSAQYLLCSGQMKTNCKAFLHPVFILAEVSNKLWMNPHSYMDFAVSCTSSMADYLWVLKCCNVLTLTFSNLPCFVTRQRCWGKCESTFTDNCTKLARRVLTDILVLYISSKYRMSGTVAPICCSCLLGNREPATLCNVGKLLTNQQVSTSQSSFNLKFTSTVVQMTKVRH
jgi:hypothetical protein